MNACAAGRTLSEATEQAHQADPLADLMAVMGRLLAAGALATIATTIASLGNHEPSSLPLTDPGDL
jgi:hypothetical protein